MKHIGFISVFVFWLLDCSAQQTQLEVNFLYDGKIIELDKNYYYTPLNDSVSFDVIMFYLSQVSLTNSNNQLLSLDKKHFLVNVENPKSCVIDLPHSIQIESLRFTIGVDSTTNANAIMTGDLDPINGMYWAWQSGFINWKIQGKCNALSTRNHAFQYHIGGFLDPFKSTRTLTLKNPDSSKKVKLVIDLNAVFNRINLLEINEILSPSQKGNELADLFSSFFFLSNE